MDRVQEPGQSIRYTCTGADASWVSVVPEKGATSARVTKNGATTAENLQAGMKRDSSNHADLPYPKFIECQIVEMTNVERGATGKIMGRFMCPSSWCIYLAPNKSTIET